MFKGTKQREQFKAMVQNTSDFGMLWKSGSAGRNHPVDHLVF
jgi:hypothetical protein